MPMRARAHLSPPSPSPVHPRRFLMPNRRRQVHGITRFGVPKMKQSVLMLASFEKTSDRLSSTTPPCMRAQTPPN
jgi:hypothetical protein